MAENQIILVGARQCVGRCGSFDGSAVLIIEALRVQGAVLVAPQHGETTIGQRHQLRGILAAGRCGVDDLLPADFAAGMIIGPQ